MISKFLAVTDRVRQHWVWYYWIGAVILGAGLALISLWFAIPQFMWCLYTAESDRIAKMVRKRQRAGG